MPLSRNVLAVASAIALASALPAAAEDLTIVSKVTNDKGEAKSATTYMSSAKYRHTDGIRDSIMDLASGTMTMVDHGRKEYWEVTAEEMRAAMERADAQMKQAQEQAKQNPQASALMEKMMGAVGEATVQKGTAPRTIAGYDCDQYIISLGDALKMELWTTPAITPPTQLYDMRRAMAAAPAGPMGQNMTKLYAEMRKIKGYALAESLTMKMMGMGRTHSTEATEVKKGPLPASTFEIPAGYKKVASPFAKMAK